MDKSFVAGPWHIIGFTSYQHVAPRGHEAYVRCTRRAGIATWLSTTHYLNYQNNAHLSIPLALSKISPLFLFRFL
ncbi:hypothetical protein IF2G_04478 [Cordyceps javanica]|nr:hypothetical protein IF2G_04478 [Cordyceps javanica]